LVSCFSAHSYGFILADCACFGKGNSFFCFFPSLFPNSLSIFPFLLVQLVLTQPTNQDFLYFIGSAFSALYQQIESFLFLLVRSFLAVPIIHRLFLFCWFASSCASPTIQFFFSFYWFSFNAPHQQFNSFSHFVGTASLRPPNKSKSSLFCWFYSFLTHQQFAPLPHFVGFFIPI